MPRVRNPVVYILQDVSRPDLVKIGKDSYWPERYSQARSQSPRQVDCVALWRFSSLSSTALLRIEKDAASGLEKRDLGNNTMEWFVANAAEARAHVESKIGRPADEIHGAVGRRSWDGVVPWDAWRDEARFISTEARRRLWAGAEIGADGAIGALKVVHSPYYDGFFKFAPTYAPARFLWLTWWQTQDPAPNDRSNRLIYDLWHRLVTEHGQGPDDLAVGWLRTSRWTPQDRLDRAAAVYERGRAEARRSHGAEADGCQAVRSVDGRDQADRIWRCAATTSHPGGCMIRAYQHACASTERDDRFLSAYPLE